jgi:hypothetical protein
MSLASYAAAHANLRHGKDREETRYEARRR